MLRCFILAAACLCMASPVLAWGPEGHQIVAEIAQKRLSVNAAREVRKLLGSESMADVANYADEYRLSHRETGPWHFVDIPVAVDGQASTYDPDRDGNDHNNVIDKIIDFRATAEDKSADRADRQFALKMIIHFVGDIHQPLHCAQRAFNNAPDRGGNEEKVHYPNVHAAKPLHSIWDGTIITEELMPAGGLQINWHKSLNLTP